MTSSTPRIDSVVVRAQLDSVRDRIASVGGDLERIRIVAVTKSFGPAAVLAALDAGIVDVGENYGRELLTTARTVASVPRPGTSPPRWHFLGSIQRREIPKLASVVAIYEGVDRVVEGEAIARHAPGATVYVEIDESGISGRGGVRAGEAAPLIESLRRLDLDVAGVMTIAPPGGGDAAGTAFALARRVADDNGLVECSMGMSEDLESAVVAGSTEVRIGRALFGGRGAGSSGATMDS
jgi:uncharacterized pyridoxal phosphate-containing UPF0001 family protein